MKRSLDIIGLPVITINDANKIGTVKSLVINPDEGSVAALVLDDGRWYYGAVLIPFPAIAGIGENAVTIKDNSVIKHITAAPDLERFLVAGVHVVGGKVLTTSGRFRGEVKELFFNQAGKITACEIMEQNGEINAISAQSICTFGEDVLIIKEETLRPPVSIKPMIENMEPAPQPSCEQPLMPPTTENHESADEDAVKKLESKHRKFLLGKKAGRRIETDNGKLIVDNGCEITEEVLQKAKLAGKFVELSMSIQ
ncbi:MAG: PRC-barrel domain protein [Firmicutes bacterium]|nr:PRC-barrel domain protein [Bacillota bacterium]